MKKLGLALGAGGARGVAHIGFLKGLEEVGVKPDMIAGTSMGSVVGAAYASGVTVEEMWNAVINLRLMDILTPAVKRGGVFGTKKMRKTLDDYIGDIDFKDLNIPFHCMAVDADTKEAVELSEGSVLDAVVASSCIPVIFSPLERDGRRLIDGYILETVPVRQVKAMGADVVVAVDVLENKVGTEDVPVTWQVFFEIIDIMERERTARVRRDTADITDFWLAPELGNMSQFKIDKVEFAYEQGYKLAQQHALAIKKALEE